MGLVKEGDRYAILTDIAGVEDHYGDMDFKVAGTREGITALQMDIKIQGISKSIMSLALEQALRARLHILDIMTGTLAQPRENISSFAPRSGRSSSARGARSTSRTTVASTSRRSMKSRPRRRSTSSARSRRRRRSARPTSAR
jgi:hypothetical protein